MTETIHLFRSRLFFHPGNFILNNFVFFSTCCRHFALGLQKFPEYCAHTVVRQCFNCLQGALRVHFHIRCSLRKAAGSCYDRFQIAGLVCAERAF